MKTSRLAYHLILLLICATSIIGCERDATSEQVIEKISSQQAFELFEENKDNEDFVIIDVRTPEEFTTEHLPGAININFSSPTFRDELNKLDKSKTYLIYCRSGNRSGQALTIMKELAFKEVYDAGGISDWVKAGYPTTT
jgi:rhodanese-related sulfurtransferase